MSQDEITAEARRGILAWRNGDLAGARLILEGLSAGPGADDALVWMGLAHVYRDLNLRPAQSRAVDRTLELDPRNPNILVMKADLQIADGRVQSACGFYAAAVRTAGPPDRQPPELRREIERAAAAAERIAGDYRRHLRAAMNAAGFGARPCGDAAGVRFARSVDIACGDAEVYHQQPTRYYFPELPQRQFYERAEFDWSAAVEKATPAIVGELQGVLQDETRLTPYLEGRADVPHLSDTRLIDNPAWSAFYLWRDGDLIREHADMCPRTVEALGVAPLAMIEKAMPSVLFSVLRPGAHIPPHHGLVNTRLICHLPLVTPEGCSLRVGNETRSWRQGELLIFDDSIEHEAWNRSDQTRVVLLFDIWRPELTAEDRRGVSALFGALRSFDGSSLADIA